MGRLQYGKVFSQTYSEQQARAVLSRIGIDIKSETVHDFLALCPYHGNFDTPSLSVSKQTGKFICFNPSCCEAGTFVELVSFVEKLNPLESTRLIMKYASQTDDDFSDQLNVVMEDDDTFSPFDSAKIDSLHENIFGSAGERYMLTRGINADTLGYFKVGYSSKQGMVTVPVYSHNDTLVGLVGRSVEGKRFKNSTGLPGARLFFNLNNAKRHSSTAIVVESSFDAMRVHQSGYPNVIATLGGHLSQYKKNLLNRYFTRVIIMTDNDPLHYRDRCGQCKTKCRGHSPGRELGRSIGDSFSREVFWASYSSTEVYPRGVKDASDMTDEEINICIKNAISDVEFQMQSMV